MFSDYYVTEILCKQREQEWKRRVRRGDFVQYNLIKVPWYKKLFSSNKQSLNPSSSSVEQSSN